MNLCTEPFGEHHSGDGCINFGNVKRIFYKNGASISSGFTGAINEAAYGTSVTTEGNWDSELGKTGIDKLNGTLNLGSHNMAAVSAAQIVSENQQVLGYDKPPSEFLFRAYKPTSQFIEDITKMHGVPAKFVLLSESGHVRVKKWASDATDIFFKGVLAVSNPDLQPGANVDFVEFKLGINYGEMNSFADYLAAFLLTK